MRVSKWNLPYHELIGLEVIVERHTDPTLEGLKGRVVDETKNTLHVEVSGKVKVVPKAGGVYLFRLRKSLGRVNGFKLLGRPEDRLKKIRR